tara:strand:- start:771 stop:1139 length:369 start_codon:yes stop_codon:yes gene_type:complete
MNMNMRHFLTGKRPIVYTDGEIRGGEVKRKTSLYFCDSFKQGTPRLVGKGSNVLRALFWNNKSVPLATREYIEECIPMFTLSNTVGRHLTRDDSVEQSRLAHVHATRFAFSVIHRKKRVFSH